MGDIKDNTDEVISKQIYFRTRSEYMVDYISVKVFRSSWSWGIEYSYCTWVEVRYNRLKP